MENILSYYYGLHPENIKKEEEKYFFEYENNKYVLEAFKRPIEDVYDLYNMNVKMVEKSLLVHEIILNNQNQILTYIKDKPYILMQIKINPNAKISLSDICYISNSSIIKEENSILNRNNWVTLWEIKNDFFESQINEIGTKYSSLCNIANYYIGLAENAISFVRSTFIIDDVSYISVSNKRINSKENLYELFNPTNYIYDYRVRNVCEYIKSAFFNGENAYMIVEEFFNNNYLSFKETQLFYGRLLYPSYFFDKYDEIVNNNLNEDEINTIVTMSKKYEQFLKDVYFYISKLHNKYIPPIDWLIKKEA